MKKGLLVLLAAVLVFSSLALAEQGKNWAGLYAGLTAGLARHEPNWSDTSYDWYGGTLTNPYYSFFPGVAVGYNYQFGSLVVGAEADASFGFTNHVVDYELTYWPTPHYRVTKTDKLSFLATVRGRVGFAVDNGLFYMTAGVGLPSAAHTWIEEGDVPDSWQTFHDNKLGIVVGLGFEHHFGQRFTAKVEYLMFKNPPVDAPNLEPTPYHMFVDDSIGVLRVGVNIRL